MPNSAPKWTARLGANHCFSPPLAGLSRWHSLPPQSPFHSLPQVSTASAASWTVALTVVKIL